MTPSRCPPVWDEAVMSLARAEALWQGAALVGFAARTLRLLAGHESAGPADAVDEPGVGSSPTDGP